MKLIVNFFHFKELYCSKACQTSAWRSYHELECPAMKNIEKLNLRTLVPAQLAVRTLAITGLDKALAFHNKSGTQLAYRNWAEQRTRGFSSKGKFLSSKFSVIYHQCADVKFAPEFLIGRVLLAICIVKALQWDQYPNACEIGGLVLKLICGHSINCHEVYERFTGFKWKGVKDIEVGNGIFPAMGLINHSCDQNVVHHYQGKVTVLRAIRCIKQGEEILDTYGPHFVADVKHVRQEMLQVHQYFECECEACTKDWPTQDKLPWTLPMPSGNNKKLLMKYCDKANAAISQYLQDRTVVYEDVPQLCQYLALMDSLGRRLSQEYFVLQEIIKVSYATKGNTYFCHE